MTVGDFKSRFSLVIASVIEGEDVGILYERSKKPVAKVSKLSNTNQKEILEHMKILQLFQKLVIQKSKLEDFLPNS